MSEKLGIYNMGETCAICSKEIDGQVLKRPGLDGKDLPICSEECGNTLTSRNTAKGLKNFLGIIAFLCLFSGGIYLWAQKQADKNMAQRSEAGQTRLFNATVREWLISPNHDKDDTARDFIAVARPDLDTNKRNELAAELERCISKTAEHIKPNDYVKDLAEGCIQIMKF